jgi:hypothetical protein
MQSNGTSPSDAATSGHRTAGSVVPWSAACPPIDPGRILRLHGYTDPEKVRPVIRSAATAVAARAVDLADAHGCWRRVAIDALGGGELRLAGGTVLSCQAFDRLLEGASEVVAFLLTLGAGFDQAVVDLIEKTSEPLEALFLETAGRLAIERLTRRLAAEIGTELAGEGLVLGTRLGPGYIYRAGGARAEARVMWPLEQQRELFGLFGAAALPVELMDSAVMRPKMSRSGLIGVHPAS